MKSFIALEHQKKVIKKLKNQRGILLYWTLGSGKTCGSIITSDILIQQPNYKNVFVLTPGSLRQNFIQEYCGYCGRDDKTFRNYKFLTYNSNNISEKISAKILSDSVIIVDEAHNIVNGRRNESKQYVAVYNAIKNAKKSKVILVTGTPLITSPYEIRLLMEMIQPNLLPNSETELKELIKQPEKLYSLIKQYIFYYENKNQKYYYPKIIEEPTVECELTAKQSEQYIDALINEQRGKFIKQMNMIKPNYVSIMYLLSRSIGNVANIKTINNINISNYSTKIPILLNYLNKKKGKHVVYSFFKKRTIDVISKLLNEVNVVSDILKEKGIKHLVFHGSNNDKQRKEILEKFNKLSNINGSEYKVLLITTAGIEGISLKAVRYLHILEPLDSKIKESQLMGRVSRYRSHDELQKEDRNVRVIKYVTVLSEEEKIKFDQKLSSDQKIIEKAERRFKEIDKFLTYFK